MEPLTSNRSHALNVEEAHRALVGVSSGLTRLWRVPGSSRTSTSTRNTRRTPGHPHSTRKSRDRLDSQTDYDVRFSQPFTRHSLGVDGLDFYLEGQMIWKPSMS